MKEKLRQKTVTYFTGVGDRKRKYLNDEKRGCDAKEWESHVVLLDEIIALVLYAAMTLSIMTSNDM